MAIKLSKTNAMLSKLSHALHIKALNSVYYPILETHLRYASLAWTQNTKSVKRLFITEKIPQDNVLLRVEIPTQVLYLKT